MKPKISSISVHSHNYPDLKWRNGRYCFIHRESDSERHDTRSWPKFQRQITAASYIRLHRAQLRLAGLPVAGWPFDYEPDRNAVPEYCDCDRCGGYMDLWYSERGDYLLCQQCKTRIER